MPSFDPPSRPAAPGRPWRRPLARTLLLLGALAGAAAAQGGSAVITLVMPVGARQLGMGEAGIALSDDVFGTFWNPAGMAFGPLANEWEVALKSAYRSGDRDTVRRFTALASKPRTGFLLKPIVWAGAEDGLLRYDGKVWRDYYEHVMEQGDKVDKVVRAYTGTSEGLDSLVRIVKDFNHIRTAKDEEDLITLKLPYNLLFTKSPVTALALDNTDRLWVGTAAGLFSFNGQGWKSFQRDPAFTGEAAPRDSAARAGKDSASAPDSAAKAAADSAAPAPAGKAAPAVTALAVKGSSVWVGTEDGLFEYKKSALLRRGETLLPSQRITSIATNENIDEIYVSTLNTGLARYTPPKGANGSAKWRLFKADQGLLDSAVHQVLLDRYGHVWTAHDGGVSHFNLRYWEKIRFKNQQVRALARGDDGSIWIGTNEGAWKHTPAYTNPKGRLLARKASKEEQDQKADQLGGWTHFHTGNGLADKDVRDIEVQGGDVWFVTGAGIERYNTAKSQVGFFYESLLPVLNLPDLYHAFAGATFPVEEWGTVGGFVNFVSFGENQATNSDNTPGKKFNSEEMVGALSYGTRLTRKLGLGLNVKFIYSALAPGLSASGDATNGIAASYALDLGLQYRDVLIPGLNLALVTQNIGPAVFYVDQAQADPIPFTWKAGASYEVLHTPNHRVVVAADANREATVREGNTAAPVYVGAWKALTNACDEDISNGDKCNLFMKNLYYGVYNTGFEYTYANVAAFRAGYLYDQSGKRNELDLGLGFMLSDILQVDGTFIKSFDEGIRNGQKRFSMILRF